MIATIDIGGGALLRSAGRTDNRLVHGMWASSRFSVLSSRAWANYRVIALDLRGLGAPPMTLADRAVPHYAKDLRRSSSGSA
jgi:pimeloyl-ACP methyl ester carboxylesterase